MDSSKSEVLKKNIEDWFYHLTEEGLAPNDAAARAIQLVKSGKLFHSDQIQRNRYDSTSTRSHEFDLI